MSKTRLSIIQGEGSPGEGRTANFVVLEGGNLFGDASIPARVKIPKQLELQGLGIDSSRLLSVGMYDIDFEDFKNLLRLEGVKLIIDIRLSNSFDKNGFRPLKFKLLLKSLAVDYIHCKCLANPFLGLLRDHDVLLAKYREYLSKECREELLKVSAFIQKGPVLLLGWAEPSNRHSERDIIIESLGSLNLDFMFDYEIISHGRNK